MSYQFRFQKILNVKVNEKEKSLSEYNDSVQKFEDVAQKLYSSLKKKELLIEQTNMQLNKGMSVQKIRHLEQFLANLEKTIEHYQKLVILTRNKMNEKQAILMQKNVEVKKYEKVNEKQLDIYLQTEKAKDNVLMDELSLQTYMYRGN